MKDPFYYLPIDIGLGLERGEEFHSGKTVVRPNYQNKKLPFTVVAGASKIHCATAAQAAETFIKLVGKSAAKQAVLEATRAAMKLEAEQNEQERRAEAGMGLASFGIHDQALTREEADDVAQCERDYASGGASYYVKANPYAKANPVYRR